VLDRPGRMTRIETSIRLANFILLYGLRTVVQLFHSLLVSVFFRCWLHTTSICASCLVSIAPFFVNTVEMLMAWASLLSCSVCVVSSVEGLMSSVFEHKFYCHQQLPFSPSTGPCVGRFFSWWKVRGASFSGPAGNFSCFLNGFCSLDPHQLDRYSAGINLQVPS
jgi:hypothetical protein